MIFYRLSLGLVRDSWRSLRIHYWCFNGYIFCFGITEVGEAIPGLDMIVSDKDAGANSEFRLELIPVKNADGLLEVVPAKAIGKTPVLIRVANASRLDYEKEEQRDMVVHVVATDGGQMSATATLSLLLMDVNDNRPRFEFPSYRFTVRTLPAVIDSVILQWSCGR